MTMTITEFLTARLDEDEAVAREAAAVIGNGEWLGGAKAVKSVTLARVAETPVDQHVARHDPARVLAEVEAKRRIVAHWADPWGQWDAVQADAARAQKDHTLRLLAAVYSDHPDYDEAWRV